MKPPKRNLSSCFQDELHPTRSRAFSLPTVKFDFLEYALHSYLSLSAPHGLFPTGKACYETILLLLTSIPPDPPSYYAIMQTAAIRSTSAALCARSLPSVRRLGLAPKPAQVNRLPVPTALPGSAALPSIPGEKEDLPGYIAIAGLAATELAKGKFAVTPELLYTSLAVYQLLYTLLGVINGKSEADRIGTFVAPVFLASAALGFFNGYLTAFQVATAAFGYYLAQSLPSQVPLPLWLASLAYAIYSGYAAEWAVAAFGLAAAWAVGNAAKNKSVPAPQQVLFLGVAAWAFYTNAAQQVALLIYAGHVLASTVS